MEGSGKWQKTDSSTAFDQWLMLKRNNHHQSKHAKMLRSTGVLRSIANARYAIQCLAELGCQTVVIKKQALSPQDTIDAIGARTLGVLVFDLRK
jgi:hypothetical protein